MPCGHSERVFSTQQHTSSQPAPRTSLRNKEGQSRYAGYHIAVTFMHASEADSLLRRSMQIQSPGKILPAVNAPAGANAAPRAGAAACAESGITLLLSGPHAPAALDPTAPAGTEPCCAKEPVYPAATGVPSGSSNTPLGTCLYLGLNPSAAAGAAVLGLCKVDPVGPERADRSCCCW